MTLSLKLNIELVESMAALLLMFNRTAALVHLSTLIYHMFLSSTVVMLKYIAPRQMTTKNGKYVKHWRIGITKFQNKTQIKVMQIKLK